MKYPQHAIAEYQSAIREYWKLANRLERILPMPVDLQDRDSLEFAAWIGNAHETFYQLRRWICEQAQQRREKLESRYPGIGEWYADGREYEADSAFSERLDDEYR